MKKQSLVSIITPTYNHEWCIGQCIESVLAQTYPYWEQIIIDDGSTDETSEIVARYKDSRIKYVRQDNVGIWRLGETYNKALQLAQGELIAVLEGDDFWPPRKLERQVPAFYKKEIVITWGKKIVTNSQGETICVDPNNFNWFKDRTREEILRKLLLQNFIPACTAMCRKDVLLSIGGFKQPDYTPYVDYPTWLELSLIGEIYSVDEILGCWRRHESQMTTEIVIEMAKGQSKCSADFFKRLPPELKNSIGISTDQLMSKYRDIIALGYFVSGRINLSRGKWNEARRDFRRALNESSLSTKTMSLFGRACSYLKLDVEWYAFLMRRPRLGKAHIKTFEFFSK